MPDLTSMNGSELLLEFIILHKVRDHMEQLMVYNTRLHHCLEQVDQDIKQINGRLFFQYHQLPKVDLYSLVDYTQLQQRMLAYLVQVTEGKGISS